MTVSLDDGATDQSVYFHFVLIFFPHYFIRFFFFFENNEKRKIITFTFGQRKKKYFFSLLLLLLLLYFVAVCARGRWTTMASKEGKEISEEKENTKKIEIGFAHTFNIQTLDFYYVLWEKTKKLNWNRRNIAGSKEIMCLCLFIGWVWTIEKIIFFFGLTVSIKSWRFPICFVVSKLRL